MAASPVPDSIAALRSKLEPFLEHAHVPYSGVPNAAAVLLTDGAWVPGVRVESASYSLVIPATFNAYTTAFAMGRRDVVAVVAGQAIMPGEEAFFAETFTAPFRRDTSYLMASEGVPDALHDEPLEPYLSDSTAQALTGKEVDPKAGIQAAREAAKQAFTPESNFPVGCILSTADGRHIPGVNVEHPDWTRILCAERNALSTAMTYGAAGDPTRTGVPGESGESGAISDSDDSEDPESLLRGLSTLYLSCPSAAGCTPCGPCRQLLLELAPELTIWMDRGEEPPEKTTPDALLPGAFTGNELRG